MREISQDQKDEHRYDDMLMMEHHVSGTHRQMTSAQRAAQFAPFAALTGYDRAIDESGRMTSGRIELSESEEEELNRKMQEIRSCIAVKPLVRITYFIQDSYKEGGSYKTIEAHLKKIDEHHRMLYPVNSEPIGMDDVIALEMLTVQSGHKSSL